MKVKQTKYSFENPEVWIPTPEEYAKKEIPVLVKLLKKFGTVKNILDVGCGIIGGLGLLCWAIKWGIDNDFLSSSNQGSL